MSFLSWAGERTGAMTMWDVGIMKVNATLFGMILGAYLASFVVGNIWWFLAAVLGLGVRGGYRWLTAERA